MKESPYHVLLAMLVAFVMTFALMPFLLQFCRKKGYYDLPGGRKVHQCAVPRLGGLLFMPSMAVGAVVALFFSVNGFLETLTLKYSSVLMAVGAFLIYIIGAVDDFVGMKAGHKFAVQLAAALLMPLCGLLINNFYGLFGLYELPLWFSYPFTVFVILLIVNSINLIDGIDGLASGLCICILVTYVFLFSRLEHTFVHALVASGLLGSLAAFFYYNMWGKAEKGRKIFMGDSGSLLLDYAIAYLSIKYAMNNPPALPYRNDALLVSYTLLIVPTFDVIRVAVLRMYHRKPVFGADKTHLHHVVMNAGFSMRQTWAIIMGLFLAFCGLNAALYVGSIAYTWIVVADVLAFWLFYEGMRLCAKCQE